MEYDLGFRAGVPPMSMRERCEEMLEQFEESDDRCIVRDYETIGEAKSVQTSLSKACRAFVGMKCTRRGLSVYVTKDGSYGR